ncbi:MAG: cation:proton antiporter [Lachnospiraceae bacterium]|jgi:Kef-type K+ transport system membrane component KefB|nr:cation:proton antiporter [Lachnospiraceae bacterium]
MTVFLSVAVALFAGLMLTRVFKKLGFNFPDVTAYLIAGLIIGPYGLGRLGVEGLGFVSAESVEAVSMINTAALGFIAFSIGSEFRLSSLKNTGRAAVVIGIFQALAATLLVDGALLVLHFIMGEEILPMPVVLTLGAIASATAPAATLMVVRQYKAHGPLTSLLLPIVALDDAVGLVVFSVSFGIARAMLGGSLDVISIVINPMLEIVFSLILGSLLGFVLSQVEKLFFSNTNRLSMTITFVFLTIALSDLEIPVGPATISFSSLLVCMMLGTVFCNMSEFSEDVMNRSEKWTAPLNAAFFVLSGAALDLGVFSHLQYVLVGIVYILARSLGKYLGAMVSSTAMGCDGNVRRYLGITLLPQAGVALGMCVQAMALGEFEGSVIRNVTLFGVLIYELAGPLMTRDALQKAGEITEKPKEKQSRERFRKSA